MNKAVAGGMAGHRDVAHAPARADLPNKPVSSRAENVPGEMKIISADNPWRMTKNSPAKALQKPS
jgi:hypothetical protein